MKRVWIQGRNVAIDYLYSMRVLLTTLNAKYIHTNLAIRLLYELNYEKHSGLSWKEFTIKEDQDIVADFCSDYDVIAFSCYIWNITQTLEVANKIKERAPATKILLGGPEVSYEYEKVIALSCVDFIIAGEGEIAFSEFLEQWEKPELVPGLIYKTEQGVQINPQPAVFDVKLFEHSMPYRFDPPKDLEKKVLYIETSRGCPYKCEFCLASLDNKVRYLPDRSIKATLLHLMEHGRVIKFLDRTFNIKRDFTLDIFRFILANRRPGNIFQFEITADILHPDIIKFIHEEVPPGLFRFEIGIQTVNQKANLEVSRKQNFDKTKKIIEELAYKVEMHLDLIVGLPLDYWDDVRFSFEEVFKLFAPEMQLGFLKFLKGTTMRDKEKHGFVYDPNPPYQIIESKYLSKDELARIVKLEHALEIYWNGGKAKNTLRYVTQRYGSFDFLLELGEYFGTRHAYHKFSLTDVFDVLFEYAAAKFADDQILSSLIAMDYYLHFRIRPQQRYLMALDKKETAVLASTTGAAETGRFYAFRLPFDYFDFLKTGQVESVETEVLFCYDGVQKGRLLRPIYLGESTSTL